LLCTSLLAIEGKSRPNKKRCPCQLPPPGTRWSVLTPAGNH